MQKARRSGFGALQAGVESLSTNVLKYIDKGVTALTNVAMLKYAKEANIRCNWNILVGFPGEGQSDIQDSIEIAERIFHLQCPNILSHINMVRSSPAFERSDELGLQT
ncbi:MAG: hypothetical protein HQL41_00805 [Alphaproteobacteria bacterium]|nr:hypothetical protein [Alphaproteobacteria bacterium]